MKTNTLVAILSALFLLLISSGEGAPKMKPMEDFDVSKFMGRWWLYQRMSRIDKDSESDKCFTIDNIPVQAGKYDEIDVILHYRGQDGKIARKDWFVEDDEEHPAQMFVKGSHHEKLGFKVVATDYENWSINNLGADGVEYVGVVTRKPGKLSKEHLEKIEAVLKENGMSLDKFMAPIDNSDCADVPEKVKAKSSS